VNTGADTVLSCEHLEVTHSSTTAATDPPSDDAVPGRVGFGPDSWALVAALVGPVAVALCLVPGRGHLDPADNALVLVVAIVAVASTGRWRAAALAAVVSALSFDVLLTKPYGSFRISHRSDLITEVLLLVVGLAVGELAARGRSHRQRATDRGDELELLHSVTELAASGQDPRVVIQSALTELQRLLYLEHCVFTRRDPGRLPARITPQGTVTVGTEQWTTEDLGLPTRRIDLPVRGNGWLLGHFVLTPSAGRPVDRHRLLVAVAIADQVGAVLASEESEQPVEA
jgi:K+-sensing histidine kinase KdpD